MTYLIIFNGPKYAVENVNARDWFEFINHLNRLVEYYKQTPDLIYLISIR